MVLRVLGHPAMREGTVDGDGEGREIEQSAIVDQAHGYGG